MNLTGNPPLFRALPIIVILLCGTSIIVNNIAAAEIDPKTRKFLNKVEKDSFLYFWNEANPNNGLIKDSTDPYAPCSVAAVGFGLTAVCVAESHGWVTRDKAYKRVLKTLMTMRDIVQHENGFFYHFVDMASGKRVWQSEASSIDTAILIAGSLYAGEYFKGTKVEETAKQIYERVDWKWMLNNKGILCMGWKPETGFLSYYWDSYNESMILYALAIASPTHPIPAECWQNWERPIIETKIGKMIYCYTGSLFVYQYSHAWIDFRKIFDGDINYFENSMKATVLNRDFCVKNSKKYKTYKQNSWGLTACFGPGGYIGYGAEPGSPIHDGTVSPCAASGSVPFAPRVTVKAMKSMYDNYKKKIYGRYGFYDSYNIGKNWWCDKYSGINQGITVLMIENYLYGSVWSYFMRNNYINKWISKCLTDRRKNPS